MTDDHLDDRFREIALASQGAKGCTPDEVTKVHELHGVDKLPAQYLAFLRAMGKEPGRPYWTYGMALQVLRAALTTAKSCCEETNFELPLGSIVIGSHDGYQFFFLEPDSGAVLVFSETGKQPGYEVTLLAPSLLDFLVQYAEPDWRT